VSRQTNGQSNHELRRGVSPVLTATGFVNGTWQFSTPYTESTPLNRSRKICDSHRWLRRRFQ